MTSITAVMDHAKAKTVHAAMIESALVLQKEIHWSVALTQDNAYHLMSVPMIVKHFKIAQVLMDLQNAVMEYVQLILVFVTQMNSVWVLQMETILYAVPLLTNANHQKNAHLDASHLMNVQINMA